MTRSIFDPDGGETERSGSTFGSEDPQNRSHMPAEAVDGRVSDEERADAEGATTDKTGALANEKRIDETAKTNPDAGARVAATPASPRGIDVDR